MNENPITQEEILIAINENLAEIAHNLSISNVITLNKIRESDLDSLAKRVPEVTRLLRESKKINGI